MGVSVSEEDRHEKFMQLQEEVRQILSALRPDDAARVAQMLDVMQSALSEASLVAFLETWLKTWQATHHERLPQ